MKKNFKKIIKIVAFIFGFLLLIVGTGAAVIQFRKPKYPVEEVKITVTATPEKVANGKKIASMLCVHCHRSATENNLSGGKILDLDPAFGVAYATNITQDPVHGIGKWTDSDIARFVRTGVKPDGKAGFIMPKFPLISDTDLESIIAYLRSDDPLLKPSSTEQPAQQPSFFAKFLATVAIKPYPYPNKAIAVPDTANVAEHGRYLTNLYACFACHSANFATLNELEPEKSEGYFGGGNLLYDANGEKIYTPNITPHQTTGIGKWTEAQFLQAVQTGKLPNGDMMQYPMQPYASLSKTEVNAIYAYLKTLPAINNKVVRRPEE
jgi:mono/diheme cytochrome c family protein